MVEFAHLSATTQCYPSDIRQPSRHRPLTLSPALPSLSERSGLGDTCHVVDGCIEDAGLICNGAKELALRGGVVMLVVFR